MGSVRILGAALLLGAIAASAAAHDSWFRHDQVQTSEDLLVLHLEGGARYPKSEWPTPAGRLASAACASAADVLPLVPRTEEPTGLQMRVRVGRSVPLTCWVELKPQDIAIADSLVPTYFDDIRAPEKVRQTWAQLHAEGVPWKEVYRKFVRIEMPQPAAVDRTALRKPLNVALELLPVGGAPLRHGVESEYVALSDGKPVEGLAVEFVSYRSPIGVWRQTDRNGRFRFAPPLPGEWLLRSTALDLPTGPGHVWHSRFATLTVWIE